MQAFIVLSDWSASNGWSIFISMQSVHGVSNTFYGTLASKRYCSTYLLMKDKVNHAPMYMLVLLLL